MAASRQYKVIALTLGKGIAQVIGLLVGMLMARMLLKTDVAAYRQTFLAYATVGPILSLGIGQGIYYFVPAEKVRIRGRVLDGLSVLAITGTIFAVFLLFGGNQLLAKRFTNPKIAGMLLWMVPYAIITTPSSISESVLVARDRTTWAAVFGVVRQLLIGLGTIVPLIIWQTAEAPLIGNVVASIMMAIASFVVMMRAVPSDSNRPSLRGSAELVKFTLPLSLAGMFGTLSLQLDKIIVSMMCLPDEFAVYSYGATEVPMIGLITGPITAVVLADMRKSVVEDNKAEALRLFRVTAEKSSLIILPALIFFMLVADTFIQYVYTAEYAASAIPFRIYLLILPVRIVVFGSLLMALGKNNFILFRSAVGLTLNTVISIWLVWQFGPWGAVAATVLTMYIWVIPSCLYVLSKELEVPWQNVLPLKTFLAILGALVPLVFLSIGIMATVQNMHLEFVLIVICFAFYMGVYWEGKLFSARSLYNNLSRGFKP